MNPFSEFLHLLAGAFDHIVGDPTHAQSATAVKTTLQAAADVAEHGTPDHLEALSDAVKGVVSKDRAATPEDWSVLHSVSTGVKGAMAVRTAPPTTNDPHGLPEDPLPPAGEASSVS